MARRDFAQRLKDNINEVSRDLRDFVLKRLTARHKKARGIQLLFSRDELQDELKDIQQRRRRNENREQWRRWYQATTKHQRQLRALKQLGCGKINPKSTGLPRWVVP